MKRFRNLLFGLLCLCGQVSFAWAQSPPPADIRTTLPTLRPSLRIFTDADGLPQNTVSAIAADRNGYLWVGTQEGAAFYNGRTWTLVRLPDALQADSVRAILPASDGTLWFATLGGGVARRTGEQWETFEKAAEKPPGQVFALLESVANGKPVIWAAGEGCVARFADGAWSRPAEFAFKPSDFAVSLAETVEPSGERVLWVGTNRRGLIRYAGGKAVDFHAGADFPGRFVPSLLATRGDDGKPVLWAGTNGTGLVCIVGDALTVFDTKNSGMPNDRVQSLAESVGPDGKRILWVGTDGGGLASFSEGRWRAYGLKQGIPSERVFAIFPDSSSNGRLIWVGTGGGGLAKLDLGGWQSFTPSVGNLPNPRVYSFLETATPDGGKVFWIGTGTGLVRIANGETTVFTRKEGLPGDAVLSLVETRAADGTKTVWAGLDGGLAKFSGGRWIPEKTPVDGQNGAIYCNFNELNGSGGSRFWSGTLSGIIFRDGDHWSEDRSPGLPSPMPIVGMAAGKSRNGAPVLWVGVFDQGIWVLEDGRWTKFADKQAGIPNNRIISLFEQTLPDGRRLLWCGAQNGGLGRFDLSDPKGRWMVFTDRTTPALPNNTIYRIAADAKGDLYCTTNKGVTRLHPRQPTAENPTEYDVRTFTAEQGLPSSECNQGAFYIDSADRIWVGTIAGAAMLDPLYEGAAVKPGPIRLERTTLNGKPWPLTPTDSFRPDQNNFAFEFAMLNFIEPGATRYSVQLVGYDPTPTPWSPDSKAVYTNLPSGKYTLIVRGRDGFGIESPPMEMTFYIRPSPWRTWWAYGLYLVALLGLGWSLTRGRVRALQADVAARQAEIEEKDAELSDKTARLESGIAHARNIQRAVLPDERDVRAALGEAFVLWKPKGSAAGDFYWLHRFGDAAWLAVGDCTGHGMPGVLMSLIASNFLNQIVIGRGVSEPGDILEELHAAVRRVMRAGRMPEDSNGLDLAVCRFAPGGVTFAGANRPLYVVTDATGLQVIDGDAQGIGGNIENPVFSSRYVPLDGPATVFLATDGFASQPNAEGQSFGQRRMPDLLSQIAVRPPDEQRIALETELHAHKGSAPQHDDVTVIGVKLKS